MKDPNCDIALWAVGIHQYFGGGDKVKAREMIEKAYSLLKKRPNAKGYAERAADFLRTHP